MRRPRRVTQADYRAGGRALARDCAEDAARGLVPDPTKADKAKADYERRLRSVLRDALITPGALK